MNTPIESKKTLLIMTVGQSDVQLVQDGKRYEFNTGNCGKLHDDIEKRTDWVLVDGPREKEKKVRRDKLPEGEVQLCTPKLDAILQWFLNQSSSADNAEAQSSLPYAVLIVETRRKMEKDPRFAGRILAKRLRQRGVGNIVNHVMLEHDERLEGTELPDRVIRRQVVHGLAKVIGEQIEQGKPLRVVLATTGGLAAVNETIQELTRLHSVGKAEVVALEVPDGTWVEDDDCAVEEDFHPAAGFRARWHALSLIDKGNYLAAWGAVQHLEKVPGQQRWVGVVKQLADFASSLPLDDACKFSVLNHPRMAARTALRVELALRAGDIPRAVHGTVAFFESALWDKLNERIDCVDQKERLFRFKDGAPPRKLIRDVELLKKSNKPEERTLQMHRPFVPDKKRKDLYKIDDTRVCMVKIAEKYLYLAHLTSGAKILNKDSTGIRQLRNDVAHNEPTNELMAKARAEMQAVKLWSQNDTFLSQPIVQGVLRELDVEAPERLCEDLLQQVRQLLLDVTLPDSVIPTEQSDGQLS